MEASSTSTDITIAAPVATTVITSSTLGPDAKRPCSRPDRSISPMAVDTVGSVTAPLAITEAPAAPAQPPAPGVPDPNGLAPLCRNDLDAMFLRFTQLLVPVQASIATAVETALVPIQDNIKDITRRLCDVEEYYKDARAQGDQYGDTSRNNGWTDYDDDYPPPAAEPTWAERAAKSGKGASAARPAGPGVRTPRGTPGAASSGPAAKSPVARPAAVNLGKLRVSTLGGVRLRHDDIKLAVCTFVSAADPNGDYVFSGGVFGKHFTVQFKGTPQEGAACVKTVLASLKVEGGGYRKVLCPSPIAGAPPVQLFFNTDRSATQMAAEFHFRTLKRAVKRARPDDHYLCDGRDKLISCQYHPIVQLQDDRAGGYRVLWHRAGADPLFSAVAQLDITKDYNTAVALGPGGG